MSNSQTSHGLSEINLEIIEALTSECMKLCDTSKCLKWKIGLV